MKAFPLQHKKMQRLTLPYMQVGTCEVMNLASTYNMESFNVFNAKNKSFYSDKLSGEASTTPMPPFLGEMVAGGLLDSYAGRDASTFVSNYLSRALSMHTVVPAELRALRKEDPANPLVDIMLAGLRRRSGLGVSELTSVVSEWDLQQYAMFADAAFFRACGVTQGGSKAPPGVADARCGAMADHSTPADGDESTAAAQRIPPEEMGCRGIWFSATVVPTLLEAQQRRSLAQRRQQLAPPPQKTLLSAEEAAEQQTRRLLEESTYCLDVAVGGVGNSRAFGVARNPLTDGTRSLLDPSRERTVPLSVDHNPLRTSEYRRIIQAGGSVDSAVGDMIDGNPFMNVSRSFGHWSMKRNAHRSPVEQKMIALPSVMTWRMLRGDALVLCNHAAFETRHQEDSSMDELAKLVGRGLDAGAPVEAIAGSLCDFAVRFGAGHSLQVMVAVATQPDPQSSPSPSPDAAAYPQFAEWLEPGPLYVNACHNYPELRRALEADCARCDVTAATLVRERWRRVRDLLPLRHQLALLPFYGKECGALQQVMEEEANFFADGALETAAGDPADPQLDGVFQKLAKQLLAGRKRSGGQ